MARGRKRGVRITNGALEKARKKIKETPKRGRWPKFSNIHSEDLADYIELFKHPTRVFSHPKYGNACYAKVLRRGKNTVVDPNFGIVLPDEHKIIASVRFYCTSYNGEEGWLIDTCCRNVGVYSHPKVGCQRISCPYHKKGFIGETLSNRTFAEDVEIEASRVHNDNIENKNK